MALVNNWYIALDLQFDPVPEEDQAVIAERVQEKVRFWSQKSIDSSKGDQYTIWRENAEKMLKDLADPKTRRRMANEALEETFGPLDKTLNMVSVQGKHPITQENLRRIADMHSVSVELALRRAKDINLTVSDDEVEDPAQYQAVFDEHYTKKPNRYAEFDGWRVQIALTETSNLYAFVKKAVSTLKDAASPAAPEEVNRLVTAVDFVDDPATLPSAILLDAGRAVRMAFFRSKSTNEKTRGTVGKYCEQVFIDDASRRDYDAYLDFVARREVMDTIIKAIAGVHEGRCSRGVGDEMTSRLDQFIGDRPKAKRLFIALCRVKGFDCDVAEDAGDDGRKIEACRCGAPNDVSGGARACTRCGRSLRQKCPRCSRESSNVQNFCACGFDFLNVLRAGTAADLAQSALDGFDLDAAKVRLAEARALDPDHAAIAAIAAAIQRLERAIGSQLGEINRQVAELNYCAAQGLLLALRESYPAFSNPVLAGQIEGQVVRARAKLAEARSATGGEEALRLCREVFAICRDLPGLQELAAQHTDLPLDALSVNEVSARNVQVVKVNHRVVVRMTTPDEGEKAVLVAYRFDAFPEGPRDPKAVVREFRAVELDQEGVLRLEDAQKECYYVAVFLKFEAAGREFFSRAEYAKLDLASKVVLTYSLSRRMLSSKLTLQLVADQPLDQLPEIAVVWATGHAPVFEESAKLLLTIPAQSVRFPCSFSIDLPSLPKNSYVKPFVHDNPAYQLKLATNSNNKIS